MENSLPVCETAFPVDFRSGNLFDLSEEDHADVLLVAAANVPVHLEQLVLQISGVDVEVLGVVVFLAGFERARDVAVLARLEVLHGVGEGGFAELCADGRMEVRDSRLVGYESDLDRGLGAGHEAAGLLLLVAVLDLDELALGGGQRLHVEERFWILVRHRGEVCSSCSKQGAHEDEGTDHG
ncbi:hypothetical protein PFISCL1PPCAC_3552, partial [Pristionchus fissidentatus]